MLLPRQRERLHFQAARRRRRLCKRHVPEARDKPLCAPGRPHPADHLRVVDDVAADVEAPDHRLAGSDRESQLRKRNPELRRPSLLMDQRAHVPDRVVIGARPGVVEPRHVALHAVRIGIEGVAGRVIVTWIKRELDRIAAWKGIAAPEGRRDLRRIPHVVDDCDVHRPVVVGDLHHRPLGGRLHVVGIVLDHVVDGLRIQPDLVVQPAVDPRRGLAGVERLDLLAGFLRHHRLAAHRAGI